MPTNRRKSHTRRDVISSDALSCYLSGDAEALDDDIELRYFTDESKIKAAWDANKPDILREWIAAHPGTRPVCWWRFDAPKEYAVGPGIHLGFGYAMRRQTAGPPLDFEARHMIPNVVCGLPELDDYSRFTFETEGEFLSRHSLLSDEERKLLKGISQ